MLTSLCFTETTPVTPALNRVLKWEVRATIIAFPNLSSDVGSSVAAVTAQDPRSVRLASYALFWGGDVRPVYGALPGIFDTFNRNIFLNRGVAPEGGK